MVRSRQMSWSIARLKPCWCGCGKLCWYSKKIPNPLYTVSPTGCWIWNGRLNSAGYAVACHIGKGVTTVSRIMYERFKGPLPDGYEPDHVCRIVSCINPDHLDGVTHVENLRRGKSTKLTVEQVTQIRRLVELGWSGNDVADLYPITRAQVFSIVKRRSWADV